MVLGILYESFIHPATILTGLPFAAFGALLALRCRPGERFVDVREDFTPILKTT